MKIFILSLMLLASPAFAGNDNFECTEGHLPEVTLSCVDENSGLKFQIYLPESESFCVENGDALPSRMGRLNGVEVLTEVEGPAFDPQTGYFSVSYMNGKNRAVEQNRCTLQN